MVEQRCMIRARSEPGRAAHTPSSKVRRASTIARCTSLRGVETISATRDSSAGFSTGNRSGPSTHVPATKAPRYPRIGGSDTTLVQFKRVEHRSTVPEYGVFVKHDYGSIHPFICQRIPIPWG